MAEKLKIGVLGAGHLGKIHLKLIREIEAYELVGFYDPDDEAAAAAESKFDVPRFKDMDTLIDAVDVVDVVTPTISHFECASKAMRKTRHVFIEKPLAHSLEEANKLMLLAEEAEIKTMVGHVERFNPAFLSVKDRAMNPMFIESHRLAQFNPRGTDVSVVLDLMIHDLDIILSAVKANVKRVSASGVAVLSDSPDIANARIEFDNGCVANVTASRISMKQMRKIRFFQRDAYISIDLLDKKSEIFRLAEEGTTPEQPGLEIELGDGRKRHVLYDSPDVGPVNAIKMELETFAEAILTDTEPRVTLLDGYRALDVAFSILNKIEKNAIV